MLQTGSLADYLYGSSVSGRSFAADLLERQSNVVIFDEFDKTGSVFHSAFYQLFDEGIFVDKNYSVDMTNTLRSVHQTTLHHKKYDSISENP